jgi:4-hydroxybutyrate dehydrogenase
MPSKFHAPEAVFGEDAIYSLPYYLKKFGIEKPLLITDSNIAGSDHYAKISELVDQAFEPALFDQTKSNPTFACAHAASSLYRANKCDGVVALGGGSVIDTAKFAAVIATHGGVVTDFLGQVDKIDHRTAPIIAIPTTAGTGSEASPDAGIHPTSVEISSGITSFQIVPRVALCDANLTKTLPVGLRAATGIDALSHCMEGFLAAGENEIIDRMALEGIRIIRQEIQSVVQHNSAMSRNRMMLAAFYGGLAIGKGLGPAHSIAISCGDQNLHHGVLSGLGLIATLDYISDRSDGRASQLREALDIDKAASLSSFVRDLMNSIKLPISLGQAGYRVRNIDQLADCCARRHFNRTSRVKIDRSDFKKLLGDIL